MTPLQKAVQKPWKYFERIIYRQHHSDEASMSVMCKKMAYLWNGYFTITNLDFYSNLLYLFYLVVHFSSKEPDSTKMKTDNIRYIEESKRVNDAWNWSSHIHLHGWRINLCWNWHRTTYTKTKCGSERSQSVIAYAYSKTVIQK